MISLLHEQSLLPVEVHFTYISFLQFFDANGYPCPMRRNPSDHFLMMINKDFEVFILSAGIKAMLCSLFAYFPMLITRKYI